MTPLALQQRRDLLQPAAALMQKTWPAYYGLDGPGDALTDLQARCRMDGLPFGMVAPTAHGAVAGLAALEDRSHGALPGETPWLVGLCVVPKQRNAGVATGLVTALMRHAADAGHEAVFATTQTATGLLTRLGWRHLRCISDDTGQWDVLRVTVERRAALT